MIDYTPFALSCGSSMVDAKHLASVVITLQWAITHKKHLSRHADKLARINSDYVWIIGSIMQAAYGASLGMRICERLTPADFETIKNNILSK